VAAGSTATAAPTPLANPDNNDVDALRATLTAIMETTGPQRLEALLTALQDQNPAIVQFAVKRLIANPDPSIEARLQALLQQPNAKLRIQVMDLLYNVGGSSSAVALVPLLRDPQAEVANAAQEILRRMNDGAAVRALLHEAQDPTSPARIKAIYLLGDLGDARAVPPLIAALHDKDAQVVAKAETALAGFSDSRTVPALIAAAQRTDYDAIKALGWKTDPHAMETLYTISQEADPLFAACAMQALGRMKDPRAVVPLLAMLAGRDPGDRAWAAQVLGNYPEERVVTALLATLHDPSLDESTIQWSLTSLGEIGDARGVPALLVALSDLQCSEWRRYTAAKALGVLRSKQAALAPADAAIDGLLAALRDPSTHVTGAAVDALAAFPEPHAVDGLLALLHDPVDAVRSRAAHSLFLRSEPRLLDTVLTILPQDETYSSCGCGLGALGHFDDPRARDTVLQALKVAASTDTSVDFPTKAAITLHDPRAITDLTAIAVQNPRWVARRNAVTALGNMPADTAARVISTLITALRDRRWLVREAAGNALQSLHDATAVAPLLAVLTNEDEDRRVRRAAIGALAKCADGRAVATLVATLSDESEKTRASATTALTTITGQPFAADISAWRAWWKTQPHPVVQP
jgi:HEAT repeat protein